MSMVTASLLSLVLAAAVAPAPPPVACNRGALDAAARQRQDALGARLAGAVRHREELANGIALTLDTAGLSLAEVGEWMALEARCCPFLDLALQRRAEDDGAVLSLSGPPEVQAFLAEGVLGGAGGQAGEPAAAAGGIVGRRIDVRFAGGDEMEIGFPAADRVEWTGIGGRCRGEHSHAALTASEVAPGLWFLGWVEPDGKAISQVIDWNAGTIESRAMDTKGSTRVQHASFVAIGAAAPAR